MNNRSNLHIYRRFAPLYDRFMRSWTAGSRRKTIELLNLKPGERLFIPGVGTGLDLPYVPFGVLLTAVDLSPVMLRQALGKCDSRVGFIVMDGQILAFPNGLFDAVLLNLILSVVPDGAIAMKEVWRVLKPGGRVVIFDKFLPERSSLSAFRRLLGGLVRQIGTDPNRRLSVIIQEVPEALVLVDQPVLLNGQYRIILLSKPMV